MEQQLSKVSPKNRSTLFRELLEIEVELRVAQNEKFYVEEYLERFPLESKLIYPIFQKTVSRKKLGDYELLDEIGRGGMGIVYRGRQIFLDQTVAIKVLSQHYHSDAHVVSRFRREMRMIGGLHHPNIVQALNAGESSGTLYLAMEYVDGYNLHVLVKKTGEKEKLRITNCELRDEEALQPCFSTIPIGAAAEVIRQAAFGLEHACEQGLVHRDLKPANLMITKTGVVKILDLGLGKFRAENRLNESLEPALTQFGATMGTVDYMAPEQWENATDVDIRADIYSLGCTLFFMLTGIAPLDAEGSMSQRQKLLARLEGSVPDIEKFRPDCPPELVEVLKKMVAGKPADRYQTPTELLEAITPLADFNELKSVLLTVPVAFESDKESTPAFRTGHEDTVHGNDWSAYSEQSQRTTRSNRGIYQSFHVLSPSFWYGYKPALLIFLCALVCFLVFRTFNEPVKEPLSVDSDSKPPMVLPIQTPKKVTEIPNFEEITGDLVQLPGLGGQWWFVEMPWYLPFVREAVPDALRHGQNEWISATPLPYLDPNVGQAREFLWEWVNRTAKEFPSYKKTLIEQVYQAFDKRLEKEEMVQVLRHLLMDYNAAISLLPETELAASDYHTIALLQHRIAQQASDQTLALEARNSYKTALEKYSQTAESGDGEKSQIARQLRMVCLSDHARLSFWIDNDFAAFEKEAETILALEDVRRTDLFLIEFFTAYGDYCTAASKNNDLLFEKANEILSDSKIAALDHPLRAYISERFAWSLIDQCKFKEAEEQFSEALRFRKNNFERSRNPLAEIYVFHNQHGLAICRRYLGDTEGAKTMFAEVAQKVEAALKPTDFQEPSQQRYFSSLNERLSNTLERYGDCVLYGGAASFGTPYSRISPSDMKLAADLYERSRSQAVNKAVWYVMSCKAAIVKSMSGAVDDAKTILDELTTQAPGIAFGSDQHRATMMRQVADYVYLLKRGEQEKDAVKIAEGLDLLRRFLLRFDSETSSGSRYRREPLELQLFCVEVLITSKLSEGNISAARTEVANLEPLLLPFVSLGSTRPFFYPFYDLAIQCFAEPDERTIINQLRFIRQSRLWQEDAAVTEERETFYFYFSPQGGFAIFAPTDKAKPTLRFTIPYTRQEVKEAAGSGKKLTLPVELADLILAERSEGRDPVISFSDLPCWFRKSDALQDADWPFDVPIPTTSIN